MEQKKRKNLHIVNKVEVVIKFIYSEKATKFDEISIYLVLALIFVAYSEYMNFIPAFAISIRMYSFLAGRPILVEIYYYRLKNYS